MKRQASLSMLSPVAASVLFLALASVTSGDMPRPTDILLKAMFVSGDTLNIGILNKIVNDVEGLYYLNGSSNFIVLRDGSVSQGLGGGFLVVDIVAGSRSTRSVNIWLDSVVVPPGVIPSGCTLPYFIYKVPTIPVPTSRLLLKSTWEWEDVDPGDAVLLKQKSNLLNFLTMADGQEAFVELDRHQFQVPDSSVTKNFNDSRETYWIEFPYYAKVKAYDWDGAKVNSWIVTPITAAFGVQKGDVYFDYPDGMVPCRVFSNSQQRCLHGIYNLPWELVITRR